LPVSSHARPTCTSEKALPAGHSPRRRCLSLFEVEASLGSFTEESITMRRLPSAPAVLTGIFFVLLGLGGCSDDKKVDTIQDSPEAKKADAGVQQGMQDFMKTKGQSKAKGR